MTRNKVAVATTSQLAADAAAEVAELGGNAVDCGIAAAMCSINTQPGVCALAGSAFVTIWRPGADPLTIDGNVAVPGLGDTPIGTLLPEPVLIDYGGGIQTLVGASSVAVPGTLAALFLASERFGELPWKTVLAPTIRAAREGFPFPAACHYFLNYAGDLIYGRSVEGHSAIHNHGGSLREVGSTIMVPYLADSLEAIADQGQRIFYEGEIGQRIVEHIQAGGGRLSREDLASYEPELRPSLLVDMGEWTIATNPPPAIGGANLAAMLLAFGTSRFDDWDDEHLRRLVRVQHAVMAYRKERLDPEVDIAEPARRMLELASSGEILSRWASASTVHTSAIDKTNTACAITASSGYGSGEMPPGTGLWLNNCLGELELNLEGLEAGPAGRRLPSNMAPSVARSSDGVMAFGSPGADRITTAIHQFLVNFLQRGMSLDDAVAAPRLHLRVDDAHLDVAVEPGLDLHDEQHTVTRFEDINMYFGGLAVAIEQAGSQFQVAADPRREGGTYIGP